MMAGFEFWFELLFLAAELVLSYMRRELLLLSLVFLRDWPLLEV